MTRYGYARVSTREQHPESQYDALTGAGFAPEKIIVEKLSGKLASRPKLDRLLEKPQRGDQVTVTRLRRIGRNHQHLLDLTAWFEQHKVDFQILEQGIETSTPGRPPTRPRARANPSNVPSTMASQSNSASAAMNRKNSRPIAPATSVHTSRARSANTKPCDLVDVFAVQRISARFSADATATPRPG